ncbi:DUF3616 domain-containing protein [candidate division KSB1 bacterium]|nr:DUF3616 domain-containing protein [candidate division KSB1 bacterium]
MKTCKSPTLFILAMIASILVFLFCRPPQAEVKATVYRGICDASAAVAVDANHFVVANDEDNILRFYRSGKSDFPLDTYNLNPYLQPDTDHPEADIEAAARLGGQVYWITSHGTNKKGKYRSSRHRFFATRIRLENAAITVTPVGKPYAELVNDLAGVPSLNDVNIKKAATRRPTDDGGLNIEGLCATPDSILLIGFRSPVPAGKALLLPLENPFQVLHGESPRFGKAIRLDLGGLGIRSIDYMVARKTYLIVAGPRNGTGAFKLYQWSGKPEQAAAWITNIDDACKPEAMILCAGEKDNIQLLSDDGSQEVGGRECKKAEPENQRFRGFWITL